MYRSSWLWPSLLVLVILHLKIQPVPCNILFLYERWAVIYCHIHNYTAWLAEGERLRVFVEIAKYFDVDRDRLARDVKQHLLQRECLKVHERLAIGSG